MGCAGVRYLVETDESGMIAQAGGEIVRVHPADSRAPDPAPVVGSEVS